MRLGRGFLQAVNRPAARKIYGTDNWPLFFMASARPEDDALVGGLWKQVFDSLPLVSDWEKGGSALSRASGTSATSGGTGRKAAGFLDSEGVPQQGFFVDMGKDTLQQFFLRCRMGYYRDNSYELLDRTVSYCYPSNVSPVFRSRLRPLVTAGEGGLPDFEQITQLQQEYKRDGVEMWDPRDWGAHKVVSLAGAVKRAAEFRATPQLVVGLKSGVEDLDLARVLYSGEEWRDVAAAVRSEGKNVPLPAKAGRAKKGQP